MNTAPVTAVIGKLVPAKFEPYAKAWLTLLGVITSTTVALWPDAPKWLAILGGVLTTVVVYLGPANTEPDGSGA